LTPTSSATCRPVNKRLAHERERRSWSQDYAAQQANQVTERLGLPDLLFTAAQFGRWERGECRPRPPYRLVVCELYDASAEALGLLEDREGTADRRTAIKAITVMGGLGALGARRLLTEAADAAVTSSRKRVQVDPMRLEEFDQDVERFAHDCLSMPHAELLPQVWNDWQQVEQLLDGRQSLKKRLARSGDMIRGCPGSMAG
jgi:transcriptional regulator with XRE-family HTH domain